MSADCNVLRPAAYPRLVAVEEYDSAGKTGHGWCNACLIPIRLSVGRAVHASCLVALFSWRASAEPRLAASFLHRPGTGESGARARLAFRISTNS
jgi:hypothetical protein